MKEKKKLPRKLSRTILIFLAFMVAMYGVGYLVGEGIAHIKFAGIEPKHWFDALLPVGVDIVLVLYGVLILVEVVFCTVYFFSAKSTFSRWDGEDENQILRAEYMLDKCIGLSNVLMIAELFLFSAWLVFSKYCDGISLAHAICLFAFYFGSFALTIVFQRSAVQLEKKINPEKRGEVLDLNFNKEWMASLDEAEKLILGKAAYKAFKTGCTFCAIMWVISVLGVFLFDFGIAPALFVTLIWLCLVISFQRTASKLCMGKGKEKNED